MMEELFVPLMIPVLQKSLRAFLFYFIRFLICGNILNATEIKQKFPRKAGICLSSSGQRGTNFEPFYKRSGENHRLLDTNKT